MIGSIIANWTCCTCNLHWGENLSEGVAQLGGNELTHKMAMIRSTKDCIKVQILLENVF